MNETDPSSLKFKEFIELKKIDWTKEGKLNVGENRKITYETTIYFQSIDLFLFFFLISSAKMFYNKILSHSSYLFQITIIPIIFLFLVKNSESIHFLL